MKIIVILNVFHTTSVSTARKITILSLFIISAIILVAGACVFSEFTASAKADESKLPNANGSALVYDASGNLIENENYVKLSDISDEIKNAFIAVEDKRFYEHHGIDVKRIAGAIAENVKTRRFTQGASTITCQLVKNTHLTAEKTFKRKMREAMIAKDVEKKYSKEEILEMYLNVIYFGKGIYGVKRASKVIFGKEPSEINAGEAAMLAATVKNPAAYSPLIHTENNRKRAQIVLSLMKEQGFISETETLSNCKIVINYDENYNNYIDNCLNSVLFEAQNLLGISKQELVGGKYKIYSYIDQSAQKEAENALFADFGAKCSDGSEVQKQIIVADNATRGVIAYASTIKNSTAFSIRRQPGSTIKPFIYATAIEQGKLIPASPLLDEKTNFGTYRPKNYSDVYYGWIDARTALAKSSNIVAVKVLQRVGIEKAFDYLNECGIALNEADKNLSLALGGSTYGTKITELCEGYQTIANEGRRKRLTFIKKITDNSGKIIYFDQSLPHTVFSAPAAYLTTDMLRTVAKNGTASQLNYLGFDVAAKTGTVAKGEGNGDAWIAGFTSRNTFVCRYGAPDGKTMTNDVTGGNQTAKTMKTFLRGFYKEPPASFRKPSEILSAEIGTYAKKNLHTLVRYDEFPCGDRESIEYWGKYPIESANSDELFVGDLSIEREDQRRIVRFNEIPEISYRVSIDGKELSGENGVYVLKKSRPKLARLQIVCRSGEKVLYTKGKWIIL